MLVFPIILFKKGKQTDPFEYFILEKGQPLEQ